MRPAQHMTGLFFEVCVCVLVHRLWFSGENAYPQCIRALLTNAAVQQMQHANSLAGNETVAARDRSQTSDCRKQHALSEKSTSDRYKNDSHGGRLPQAIGRERRLAVPSL